MFEWLQVALHFSTVFRGWIGLGFISMPYGYQRAGWLAASMILLVISALALHCALLLVRCKYTILAKAPPGTPCTRYGDVAAYVGGSLGTKTLDALLFFTQFGFCVSYCVFMLRNVDHPMGMLALAFALWPFVLVDDIGKLGTTSFLGSCAMFAALTLCYAAFDWSTTLNEPLRQLRVPVVDYGGVPVFVGMASSAMCGIGLVLPFESSLQAVHPSPKTTMYYSNVLLGAVGLTFVILASFGHLGSQSFGVATLSVVTLNFDPGTTSTKLISFGLMLSIYVAFPLQFAVVRSISEHHVRIEGVQFWRLRLLWRMALIVIIVWIASRATDFGLVYGFIGALGGGLLSYVLPLFFFMRLAGDTLSRRNWVFHLFLLAVSIFAVIVSTGVSALELVTQMARKR